MEDEEGESREGILGRDSSEFLQQQSTPVWLMMRKGMERKDDEVREEGWLERKVHVSECPDETKEMGGVVDKKSVQ